MHDISYIGRPCFPIHKPLNGVKKCSGYRMDDRCNFGCLPGYNLIGSGSRTCGPNKQWTGNDTKCKSKLRIQLNLGSLYVQGNIDVGICGRHYLLT